MSGASQSIPYRRVRGVRENCPAGHVVGRISGDGQAQFIPLAVLGNQLATVSQALQQTAKSHEDLVFTAPGLFASGQTFNLAPCPVKTTFPAKKGTSTAICGLAPTGSVTIYLINDLLLFLGHGAPNGCIAQMVFSAGSKTGVLTWLVTTVTINVGDILSMAMPATEDNTFSQLTCVFIGDPA